MLCWSVKARPFLAILLSAVLVTACRLHGEKHNPVIIAPNFELKDLSGNKVRLDAFRGHPVLLDFWATWCGPCRMSIPIVEEFYQRHQKDGLVVLGMNIDDEPAGVFGFVKHFNMTYPVLFAANSSTPSDYEVDGIPYFVFIDEKGQILQIYQGFNPEMLGSWEDVLQFALKNNH
jgi:thiol-disulfide isomerase/thioredoxin